MNTKPLKLTGLLITVVALGCGDVTINVHSSAEQASTQRQEMPDVLSPDPLDGATHIEEAVASWKQSAEDGSSIEATVAGIIYAGDHDPFQPDRAAFLISEIPEGDHEGGVDHIDNCPFCKRSASRSAKAFVEVRDADGESIEQSAAKLFGLEKGDIVEVTGMAEYDTTVKVLSIDATKIHRR